jgi:hypothetical protein
MELNILKEKLNSSKEVSEHKFEILKSIVSIYNKSDNQSISIAQNLVLRAMDKYEHFGYAQEILDSLIRELGLFPYLDPEKLSLKDLLAYETYRASIGEKDIVFHAPQANVFYKLMSGKSVVLSAPTSFGKSLITDAVIASNRFKNIVIVVPTISLIDETRRRLSKFRNFYKIITHSLQNRSEKNIYILTQERVLEENFIDKVDFFVIDEFYKLSLWSEDVNRCALLNEAFYRLYKKCEHFYMLGPNIHAIIGGFVENVQFEFINFNYNTVVTEFHDYTDNSSDKNDKLYDLCQTIEGQTVIFCSSPARANEVANILCSLPNNNISTETLNLANWVTEKYHKDWILTKSLNKGIAIHHARIPRGVSQYIVELFNNEKLKFLICTSTLIEGVNTSARNIICYDNKISNKNIDIFTFNNIAGRSGRMFQHFIGHVYLFSPKPIEQLSFVDVPVYTQGENAPESLLINMDRNDLSERSEERVKPIYEQNDLSVEVIRENKTVEPKYQIEFAKAVYKNIGHWENKIIWRGYPNYEQLQFICEVIWQHFSGKNLGNHSVNSPKQLAFKIKELSQYKSIKQLIIEAHNYRFDESIDEIVGRILDFRRMWANFHFPRLLNTIESIVNDVQKSRNSKNFCDYSAYSTNVENYFYDASLIALEEYGLPLEVSILFKNQLSTEGDLDLALERLNNVFPTENMSYTDATFIDRAKSGY